MTTRPEFWWAAPGLGEIVWCWWPDKGSKVLPGPKPRPCLVLELDESDPVQPHVLVAYGTSRKLAQLHPGEFAITRAGHPHAFAAAGLSFDTKFNMGQTAWLPYSTRAFDVAPGAPHGQTPKLGVLHPSVIAAAAAAHMAAWP
ncbi:type II toxin-antitoxin system PemK/MazF family toxin [Ramlibacter albus]|uniref:Type II toxin-antitoxin system PemK/MazF family toxin n=1 Tax=Ramlibacter albus TaxID=2079448 RepID=A0A923MEU5_9BURK|nr:type II toxin-antitoxin system PemK/MazF family toxin [Ramlibacter albus]MBC5768208.1 type II toxin-antitoxin system PemK/MazF family toxin [Ramlibacter albus]